MTTTASKHQNMSESVVGSHGCRSFLSPSAMFVVGFNDLWDLFNLTQLDTGLLRCYSLMCWRESRKKGLRVGFLDPSLINERTLKSNLDSTVEYIGMSLWAHQDKKAIFLAHNQQAWKPYVTKGGKHEAKRKGLTHKLDFPIAQQTGLMCGFHFCHHMSNLYQQVNTLDPELASVKSTTFDASKIRGEIAAFLLTDVINPKGQFHASKYKG
uniref:Ubiquitin-like protease family profile domain-containing protein n=1 Tax=Oryza brachyantha TaxID=4533 RepID=J3LW07_ORYBR